MEATKYMRAYKDFLQPSDYKKPEKSRKEHVVEILKVINSGEFYGVISAYVPGDDADTLEECHQMLMKDILKLKYGYYEQSFGYDYSDGKGLTSVKRKSLFVPGLGYHELISLGKKWNQETIAFGGNGGITVARVIDEKVLLDMTNEDMLLSWNFLLGNQRNIPW
jgi:hypothetical protein